jgi:hypothetical protein
MTMVIVVEELEAKERREGIFNELGVDVCGYVHCCDQFPCQSRQLRKTQTFISMLILTNRYRSAFKLWQSRVNGAS